VSSVLQFVCIDSDSVREFNYKLFRQTVKMADNRIASVLTPFNGEGDVTAWLSKVELVVKLTKKKADLAAIIPLYLEGGALAVYLELSAEDQLDADKIKNSLTKAFSDSAFTAFSKLKALEWRGESVDIFATNLRRLARESGFTEPAIDDIVRLAFITGVPHNVSMELQQLQDVESLPVADILSRARVLMASKKGAEANMVVAGAMHETRKEHSSRNSTISCWECGGPHIVRYCPSKKEVEKTKIKCFRCGGPHIIKYCNEKYTKGYNGNKDVVSCQLETVKGVLNKVPVINVTMEGKKKLALVDTGCTQSMMLKKSEGTVDSGSVVMAFDGREVSCSGMSTVKLCIGEKEVEQHVRLVESLAGGLDFVLGMDVITQLGGVTVDRDVVRFGTAGKCSMTAIKEQVPNIVDKDFDAWFDGEKWVVRYKWNENGEPVLKNRVSEYKTGLDDGKRNQYETEVERWIEEGILVPWKGEEGGLLPLMAVEQATKNKIRPVLDFRELNQNVNCHTGDDGVDVCGEKMREWRQVQGATEVVDLKAAYLQIHISEDLWKHQLVRFKGCTYCLTRLGFGLNAAPRIMSKILTTVLQKDGDIAKGTSSYIDDIYVATTMVKSQRVIDQLSNFGLKAKEPEKLDGGSVLGLKLKKEHGSLQYKRANEIPELPDKLTKRELYSICGKLTGHYPTAGWLRVACSFLKRHVEAERWSDAVDETTSRRLREMVEHVRKEDPVHGTWQVNNRGKGVVWCDASDLALGVVVEIEDAVVEDGAWMRKADDYAHINVAELEAVLKGINLCLKWGLKEITVKTDSATVVGWLKLVLSGEKRVKTKGAAEILIRRRLGVLKDLVSEIGLRIQVEFVKSAMNKADALTRVWKKWMVSKTVNVGCMSVDEVREMHDHHHMGVERTWYLTKKVDETTPKEVVKKVVGQCGSCQSIDPAPVRHLYGQLCVEENWDRAAVDVVHYKNIPYLSFVDCGPGRFAIWRKMKGETATEICGELESIFYERGPVRELLMDNATSFRAEETRNMLERWGVMSIYRAAWRPSGNGIVERHHRTIKAMAERMRSSPIEAVYWYNVTPKDGQKDESVPHRSVCTYDWRLKGYSKEEGSSKEVPDCELMEGDEVWVKPGNARCTTHWNRGLVTHINSDSNVDVDGMPRHILDLRRVKEEDIEREAELDTQEPRRSGRTRNPPAWLGDYCQD